uniref:Ig-like domain-containing protein n=1 Tax=Anopheles atroparvus TaxID=41427 RepID=A0A182J9E0_ANOAO
MTHEKRVPVVSMEALVGETIFLPCNISTHEPGDNVVLVLWYREDKGSPIYSADTRGRDVTSAKRWSDDAMFGDRAYFKFDKQPGELAVQNVRETDSGMYRCRVDFIVAQTRNSVRGAAVGSSRPAVPRGCQRSNAFSSAATNSFLVKDAQRTPQ